MRKTCLRKEIFRAMNHSLRLRIIPNLGAFIRWAISISASYEKMFCQRFKIQILVPTRNAHCTRFMPKIVA